MADASGPQPSGQPSAEPLWLSVKHAARALVVSEQAIRRRIKRGTIETRREVDGNHTRVVVRVESPLARQGGQAGAEQGEQPDGNAVALLAATVERLEAEATGLRAEHDRLQGELTARAVEAAELRGRVEELRARLAEATRPGPVARLVEALAARLTGRGDSRH